MPGGTSHRDRSAQPAPLTSRGAGVLRCAVWGVLNVTPDSFSDGGQFLAAQDALARGLSLGAAGADVVDVGGESTRPAGRTYGAGYERVGVDEEVRRTEPVVAGLVALGAVIVAVVSATHKAESGWQGFAPKLTLTLLIGALAAYCGSVANDHRKAEKQARALGLQLAAIKPYLHDLTDPVLRDVVLSVVATQLFNGTDSSTAEADAIKSLGVGGQIGDLLVEQLGKALLAKK